MLVVSDTSPLGALHHLKITGLLAELFDVVIPPAVVLELTQPESGLIAIALKEFALVRVVAPSSDAVASAFRRRLDGGESESLALALEMNADAVLIDEQAGRLVAEANGLTVIGAIGVLREAKALGLITAIRPLRDSLRGELKFFISDNLYDRSC